MEQRRRSRAGLAGATCKATLIALCLSLFTVCHSAELEDEVRLYGEEARYTEGEKLSDEESDALLQELPPLRADEEEEEPEWYGRLDAEVPPIELDEEQQWSIEGQEPPAQAELDGPLQVMAVRPEGEMEVPTQVAVTFDRPVAQLGRVDPDVESSLSIEPEVEGQWRWIGTRTVVFEPAKRWPRATNFSVEIGQGLRALDGAELNESVGFEFSTPRPELVGIYPRLSRDQSGRIDRLARQRDEPVIVVFDQPVDSESASSIRVYQENEDVPMQLLSGEARREAAQRLGVHFGGEEERMIALSPKRDYGPGTVNVEVEGPVLPAEGPEVSTVRELSRFSTYHPLELFGLRCISDSFRSECHPDSQLKLRFNNSIDSARSEYTLSLKPDAGEVVEVVSSDENVLKFEADLEADQEYEVRFEGGIYDHYGQRLEVDEAATISVSSPPPRRQSHLRTPSQHLLVRPLDGPRSFHLEFGGGRRQKVEVRVYGVAADEFHEAQRWGQRLREVDREPDLTEVFEYDQDRRYEALEPNIDYSAVLGGDEAGHVMVVVDTGQRSSRTRDRYRVFWVQHTDLAATMSSDERHLAMTVSSLSDGGVVSGAQIWADDHLLGTTDERGIVDFAVSEEKMGRFPLRIISDGDSLVIPPNGRVDERPYDWSEQDLPPMEVLWHVVDDSGVYRPGEEFILRGWLRSQKYTPDGLPRIIEDAEEVEYRIRLPQRRKPITGEVDIDGFGGFDLRYVIPEDAHPGEVEVELRFENEELAARTSHTVEVREFRRPRFELSLEPEQKTQFGGEALSWTGRAEYLTGGGVADGDTRWSYRERWASFRPSGWSSWRFASSVGWPEPSHSAGLDVLSEEDLENRHGSTDERGAERMAIELGESEVKAPRRVTTTFSVTDVDRQSWEASEEVMVHPAKYYAGVRPRRVVAQEGEPFEVDVMVVDTDGERVEGQEVELVVYRYRDESEVVLEECQVKSRSEVVTCEFDGLEALRRARHGYWIRGEVRDEEGRVSGVRVPVRIYGSSMPREAYWFEERPELDLVVDKEELQVGETAQVLVDSPHYPLRAEVELRREGRAERRQEVVTADEPFIEVPVDASMVPNTHLWVSAIALGEEYDPYRVLEGSMNLEIPNSPHRIDVEIDGEEEVEAGEETTFEIRASDASGQPVADAQILFFAVDEASLLLGEYELTDPIDTFYPSRQGPMMDLQTRAWFLAKGAPDPTAGRDDNRRHSRYSGDRRGTSRHEGLAGAASVTEPESEGHFATDPMRLRQDFDPVAFFRSDLVTDDRGRVSVTEAMPDNLSRYRVMAVAVAGDHKFGRAETEVKTPKELMVKPSSPRFLSVGDQFDFSVVVHNGSDESRTVDVALRSTEHLQWPQGRGQSVEVPAEERVEIAFVGQSVQAGDAEIQVLGRSGEDIDASHVDLPVLTPATTETFATYGSIADGDDDVLSKEVSIPPQIDEDHGELRVSFSSTQVHSLSDALYALVDYEYETAHVLASKILGALAVYDLVEVFDVGGGLGGDDLDKMIQGWVDDLEQRQDNTGGFDGRPRHHTMPFATVHGSYALWRAHQEGFDVDDRTLSTVERGLRTVDRHTRHLDQPHWRAHVDAYALFVRHEMDGVSERELDRFLGTHGIDELHASSMARLLPLAEGTQFEDELKRRILKAVDDAGSVASLGTRYGGLGTDAIVLDGLLRTSPDHPLIEKLASQLLDTKHRGRWRTPQANSHALDALRRYFDTYEEEDPHFVARSWLRERQVFEGEFDRRDARAHGVEVAAGELLEKDEETTQPLILQRDGQGRMYYRVGLRYAPLTRSLSAMNQGFWVERSYAAIDDDDDVRRTEEGWEIRAGARVRVELTMIPGHQSRQVVLVDWIPAGLEVVDPALATNVVEEDLSGDLFSRSAQQAFQWRWWDQSWYEHVNLRDKRVEVFAQNVDPTLHSYSYVTRATTPGEFVAMPARAESTWEPDIFGRSEVDVVRVVR